ncbi:NmrA-like family protein [Penicillium malachiteum]|uniref:NmrA-like family protein n=1 Tax=Penicillium malachiteum TaxID=1324776 RepID=UPI00254729AE|nr:NmrA-like family protein [Penicillium malachiteum]KAJ5726769.1 NmrA-like family protein [Penicillium malachiteum]
MGSITVGIAGITGKFARCVVGHLLKQPNITIKGYCRDSKKLPPGLLASERITITQGQSDDNGALRTFARGSDVVVCCYLGDHKLMVDGQKALIDACEAEAVPRYVASDYSLDFTKLEFGQLPAKDPMKHIQAYLKTKKVQGVHVLIGIFMETFFSSLLGVWNADQASFSYWGSGEEMWESTTYDNAAQFVAAVTQDPTAVGVQRFLGDRKNIRQIAAAFEEEYKVKPWLNYLGSLEELKTHMEKVKNLDPSKFMAWIPLFYQYYCNNGQTYLTPDVDSTQYPEIPRLTFNQFFRRVPQESLTNAAWSVGSNVPH